MPAFFEYLCTMLMFYVYFPYALFFCFSANCYLDVLSSVSVALFNWPVDSLIPYQSDFLQCSVHDFDGYELAKSSVFTV